MLQRIYIIAYAFCWKVMCENCMSNCVHFTNDEIVALEVEICIAIKDSDS